MNEKCEMSDKIYLNQEDVVSMDQDANVAGASTSTVEELMERVRHLVHRNSNLQEDKASDWVAKGVVCKLLLAQGGGWQKGKIRLRLEFIPDQPRSELDDLRSQLSSQ
jgi:KGK domain